MRANQIIAIALSLALIAIIYKWGITTPPDKVQQPGQAPMASPMAAPASLPPFALDSFINAAKAGLNATAANEMDTKQKAFQVATNDADKAGIYFSMAHIWEINNYKPIAAYFGAQASKLENSEKKLNFAGQFFLELLSDTSISASMRVWEANEAIACFKRALDLNSDNDSTKINLALAYIDGTGEAMQGIQLLLALTREKPDHLAANLLLGKLAVRSAQWDKAIKRLENLLQKYPDNTEAIYFLAEAYKGSGNKEKAIALFEQCKRLVNKPEFSKEIDEYINSFK